MSSVSGPSPDADATIEALLDYCADHGVSASSKITHRRIPGRGIGVYSTARILKGEQLMQVPATALLTTKSIPSSFASLTARKRIPVHALLAAYLAFGLEEQSNPYKRWMATWPDLANFTSSTPMLWPERIVTPAQPESDSKPAKRQKTLHLADSSPISILPPPTTGAWSMSSSATDPRCPMSVASAQRVKVQLHLKQVAALLPQHAEDLLSPSSSTHWRFIHMWCCVNTRCFYYLRPRQSKPADPNEAMALCPGMDLFNHTDKPGCPVKYDKNGYEVIADRNYDIGEEVLLSYGSHTNDVLWAEYGFTMEENADDAVRIDEIVLTNIKEEDQAKLKEYGYFGDYWLKKDGPCWRTEVAAWGQVLNDSQWKKVLEGTWTPSSDDKSCSRHRRQIEAWLDTVSRECERSIEALRALPLTQIINSLGDAKDVMIAQGYQPNQVARAREQVAAKRHGVCLGRWEQIRQMSIQAGAAFTQR